MPDWILRFDGVPLDEANVLAANLRAAIRDAVPDVSAEVQRERLNAMDFGASLALVLGTPAVVVLAKAIYEWARRTNRGSINLHWPDGHLEATGLESKDVAELVRVLGNKR